MRTASSLLILVANYSDGLVSCHAVSFCHVSCLMYNSELSPGIMEQISFSYACIKANN